MKATMEPCYLRMADRIRDARRDLNLSQLEVAFLAKISRPLVAAFENGNTRIMLHQIYPLCRVLKLDPVALITDCMDSISQGEK